MESSDSNQNFEKSDEIGGLVERVPEQMSAYIEKLRKELKDQNQVPISPVLLPSGLFSKESKFWVPTGDGVRRLIIVRKSIEDAESFNVEVNAFVLPTEHRDRKMNKGVKGHYEFSEVVGTISNSSKNAEIQNFLGQAHQKVSSWHPGLPENKV